MIIILYKPCYNNSFKNNMTTLSESINEIKTHILVAESELNSLIAGKKASASRTRKSLQEVKKLSHLLRKGIVEFTKSLPTKKRTLSPKPVETAEPKTPDTSKPVETSTVVEPKPLVKKTRLVKRNPTM